MEMKKSKLLFWIIFFVMLFFANELWARAGGGFSGGGGFHGGGYSGGGSHYYGGHRSGGGHLSPMMALLAVFMVPLIVGLILLITWLSKSLKYIVANKRTEEVLRLTQLLMLKDKSWTYNEIQVRISDVFFEVQKAWMARDLLSVEHFISERFYRSNLHHIQWLNDRGWINVLEAMKVKEVKLIGIEDYLDDSKDKFSAFIKFAMTDFYIDENTRRYTGGNTAVTTFEEIWHFVKKENYWVVDFIDNEVTFSDFVNSKVKSEV